MALQGIAFLLATVVGIGLAAYMFYSMETPSSQSYRSHSYQEDNSNTYNYSYPSSPRPPITNSSRPSSRRRSRRGSNESEANCIICCESMETFSTRRLACTHIFHSKCIEQWYGYDNNKTCPLCRSAII